MKKLQTFWMLVCLLLVTSAAIARDLKLGMKGADVKQWQVFLQVRNFDLPADGYFGPVTKRATLIFQKKWKLYADGVVGTQTLRKAKTLGYGSTSGVASGKSRTYSNSQSVSKETERIVIQKSITYRSYAVGFCKMEKLKQGCTLLQLAFPALCGKACPA